MPRKKQNKTREAALRREANKREQIQLLNNENATRSEDDMEVVHDPTSDQPVDVMIEAHPEREPSVGHANVLSDHEGSTGDISRVSININAIIEEPLSDVPVNVQEVNAPPQRKHKRKSRNEDSDIYPDKRIRSCRATEWRYANGKTKKARAIQMQASIADIFKVKPNAKCTELQIVHEVEQDNIVDDSEMIREVIDFSKDDDEVMIVEVSNNFCEISTTEDPIMQTATPISSSVNANIAHTESLTVIEDVEAQVPESAAEDTSSNPSIPFSSEAQDTECDINEVDICDDEFVRMHNRLARHVDKLKRDYMKKRVVLTDKTAAHRILDLDAIAAYNERRYKLTMERNALQDRVKGTRGVIRRNLIKRKNSIRPAMDASEATARQFGKTPYYARTLRSMALHLLRTGQLPESRQGKGAYHKSYLDLPDVKSGVESWLKGEVPLAEGGYKGEINGSKLWRYVNEFLFPSLCIEDTICLSTAVSWLKRLGYSMCRVRKGVYVDGHERPDVKLSRTEFLDDIYDNVLLFADEYVGDDVTEVRRELAAGQKRHYPIFHDETCFHANDRQNFSWIRDGQQPLRSKGRGRIVHTSDFIMEVCGRLTLNSDEIAAQMLLPECPKPPENPVVSDNVNSEDNTGKGKRKRKNTKNATPVGGKSLQEHSDEWVPPPPPAPFESYRLESFDARRIIYPGSGYDPWWDMSQLIAQTKDAIKIFDVKFPDGVAVFIFDCSSAHEAFASDALLAHKMNRGPGGQQPHMHDTINPFDGTVQSLVFPSDYTGLDKDGNSLAGKPKGMEQVLRERGLLSVLEQKHGNRLFGVCKTCKLSQAKRDAALKEARSKQDEIEGSGNSAMNSRGVSEMDDEDGVRESDCCMQRVLSLQPDFRAEKPLLQLVIEKAGYKCLFLPKFHCELNPIEMVWGLAKQKFRSLADGTFKTAKELVPQCLDAITTSQIRKFFRHCWRYMSAYRLGLNVRQASYAVKKYTSHRRVPQSVLMDVHIVSES